MRETIIPNPEIDNSQLAKRLENFLESNENLGFAIGSDQEVFDFLGELALGEDGMRPVEDLIKRATFTTAERETILNTVEENAGRIREQRDKKNKTVPYWYRHK